MMNLSTKIRKILALVNKAYGKPAPMRKTEPVDELIRTVLSQNTSDKNSIPAFKTLKKSFKSWCDVEKAGTRRIASLIAHAGLANIKARRIKGVLAEIDKREGRISLARLKGLSVQEGLEYLISLKGVGPKTASCVMLFSFGKPAMPVDTHIFRVTKRLGLIDKGATIEDAHRTLSDIVPKVLIYEFHLGIIEHGRNTCKAVNPRCASCAIFNLCDFKEKNIWARRG